jgi:hypothetical protein
MQLNINKPLQVMPGCFFPQLNEQLSLTRIYNVCINKSNTVPEKY